MDRELRVVGAGRTPGRVHLDVRPLGLKQLLVDVRLARRGARLMLVGVELGRLVANLAEEPLRAAAGGARVVDADVVVLA